VWQLVWLLASEVNYKSVEKIFLAASVFYIAYIVAGVLSQPSWHEALVATVKLHLGLHGATILPLHGDRHYRNTIAPWMQFYLQSSM